MRNGRIAIITVTRNGALLGARLQSALVASDLLVQAKFNQLAGTAQVYDSLKGAVETAFREYDGLVMFLALGATIRLIAPHLSDKRSDPAVVVVDEQGRFAISVLSGHIGGGNALAARVANLLGAQPVITTASDSAQTISVDLLGRQFGWRIEDPSNVTRVSAAIVNGEQVAVLQEAGEEGWWTKYRPLPPNVLLLSSLDEVRRFPGWALLVTDRLFEARDSVLLERSVVYRPRSLAVGIGCNRGTPASEIEQAVEETLGGAGLSKGSIRVVATVELKKDEAGILEYCEKFGHQLQFFSKHELDGIANLPNRSDEVRQHIGISGVCEPAAILAGRAGKLVAPKRKSRNVTVAVARIDFGKGTAE
ncbi:MAG: cobalt-precorrin 5A hydrolase [Chloroflexi bacterium]|nr:cobalt-precorrin 5A hydrolase [Chloroflexota bacterium]